MLSPDELRALRRLLAKAGGEKALHREIRRAKRLPKRGPGQPAKDDDTLLIGLEWACRIAARRGIKRHTALRGIACGPYFEAEGKTVNAIARRYARKLRKRNVTDEEMYAMLVRERVLDPTEHLRLPPFLRTSRVKRA